MKTKNFLISKKLIFIALLSICFHTLCAQEPSQKEQWQVEGYVFFGTIAKHNDLIASFLENGRTRIYDLRVNYRDFYSHDAASYHYPLIGVGFSVIDFSDVRLLGNANKQMGNMYALYGSLNQTWLQIKRLKFFYACNLGIAYHSDPYDAQKNPYNQFTSSHLLCFIGLDLGTALQLSDRWALCVKGSARHSSNGRLGIVNAGFNILGGNVGLSYCFPSTRVRSEPKEANLFTKHFEYHLSAGGGVQTYLEDVFAYPYIDHPENSVFYEKLYPKYFLSTDAMYRFSKIYSCGIGLDLFYVPFTDSFRVWDRINPDVPPDFHSKYNSWSTGLAFTQEVYYNNLALALALGYYLYRDLGFRKQYESPIYQRVGLRYYLPAIGNLFCGFSIKGHQFHLAEYIELAIGKKF